MKRCANANEGSFLIALCQFSNALWICSFSNSTIPDSNSLRASGRDVVMFMLVACEAGGSPSWATDTWAEVQAFRGTNLIGNYGSVCVTKTSWLGNHNHVILRLSY